MWRLGRCLAHWLVKYFIPEGPISLVGDEKVDGYRDKNVLGKVRH
jgi:hypothetical protein